MKRLTIIIFSLSLLCCGPATNITGTWRNPNVATDYINTILVTAISNRVAARQTVENDLQAILEKKGLRAIKSIDVLPPAFIDGKSMDKKELFDKVSETKADAILTVALIDEETETRFIPGSAPYQPMTRFGYYGRFWGYYNAWYPALYSPGYYEEHKVYFLETNLYDARTEELLWSAQSETMNPNSLASFSKEFAEVVYDRLRKEGVLKK